MSERIDSLCQELSLGAVLLQYANLADQAARDEAAGCRMSAQ